LRQVHGPEPAGPDQTHPDGSAVAFALFEQGVEVHRSSFVSVGRVAARSVSDRSKRPEILVAKQKW
jgi:Tol biopolymer transport system component